VLIGDFNFDTSNAAYKRSSGLEGLTNVCEGQATWTNEGVAHLRGDSGPIQTESVDAILANSPQVSLTAALVEKVTIGQALLSDHYAVSATADVGHAEEISNAQVSMGDVI
jgi:endonuclease/exonuclease/phosphatase family metal-dependent hydrolase